MTQSYSAANMSYLQSQCNESQYSYASGGAATSYAQQIPQQNTQNTQPFYQQGQQYSQSQQQQYGYNFGQTAMRDQSTEERYLEERMAALLQQNSSTPVPGTYIFFRLYFYFLNLIKYLLQLPNIPRIISHSMAITLKQHPHIRVQTTATLQSLSLTPWFHRVNPYRHHLLKM